MCKRKLGIFLVIASCVCLTKGVNAACDYETQNRLKSEAANIRAVNEIMQTVYDYDGNERPELKPEDVTFEDSYYIGDKAVISFMNLTNDLYVVVNDGKSFEKKYAYSETNNGTLEFEIQDLNDVTKYNFTIYSNNNDCKDTELRKIEVVVPMYNPYSDSIMCDGMESFYYCQPYITEVFTESYEEINGKIFERYKENRDEKPNENQQEETFWNKVANFMKENVVLITVVVILVIGGATAVWYIKKRRSEII